MNGLTTLLTALAICCGCGHFTPAKSQQSAVPVAQVAGKLTVEKAVALGMKHSIELRAAAEEVTMAEADVKDAASMTHPQLSATTTLSYGDSPAALTNPAPGSQGVMLAPQKLFGDQNFAMMAPLYTGGRLQALVSASRFKRMAAGYDLDDMRTDVAMRIREAFFRANAAEQMVEAAKSRLTADEELLATTRSLYDAGKSLESEMRRVEAEREDTLRSIASAQTQHAKALLDLKTAMGVSLDSDVRLESSGSFVEPTGDVGAYVRKAKSQRQDLAALNARRRSSSQSTKAARAQLLPQVYAAAMTDSMAPTGMAAKQGYMLSLVVSIPIMDGGQRKAAISSATAAEAKSIASTAALELKIEAQVRAAWLDLQTANHNLQSAKASLAAAESAYRVTALRVANQKSILLEQLDGLAEVSMARNTVAQALYDCLVSAAALKRACGEQ